MKRLVLFVGLMATVLSAASVSGAFAHQASLPTPRIARPRPVMPVWEDGPACGPFRSPTAAETAAIDALQDALDDCTDEINWYTNHLSGPLGVMQSLVSDHMTAEELADYQEAVWLVDTYRDYIYMYQRKSIEILLAIRAVRDCYTNGCPPNSVQPPPWVYDLELIGSGDPANPSTCIESVLAVPNPGPAF